MSPLNEADTRAKLIDPKLKAAGWGESHIEREHFFRKGLEITKGRVYLVGKEARRAKPKRVDYLFRYKGLPIAILEAKEEAKAPGAGLEQAKDYAESLDVPFCYSSNGHNFIEYNFLTHSSKDPPFFPKPEDLWKRWQDQSQIIRHEQLQAVAEDISGWQKPDPILYPYCPPEKCGNISPHYFQETAIRRSLERVVAGHKRILLTMATGTGKTFIAFQIAWKLLRSGWFMGNHPDRPGRILFLRTEWGRILNINYSIQER